MEPTSNIFHDLEIPMTGFLDSKDTMMAFAKNVANAAKELEKTLEESTSVSSVEDQAKADFNKNKEFKVQMDATFKETLKAIYESCEDLPLPVVYGLIGELKTLANDLSNTLNARARMEVVNVSPTTNNKKLAQLQHKRLRENWEIIRKLMKLLNKDLDFPAIKPRSGNFAVSAFDTYAFIFPGEEEPYYNYRAVAKKLDILHSHSTFMDVIEYAENHPELVQVVKVQL